MSRRIRARCRHFSSSYLDPIMSQQPAFGPVTNRSRRCGCGCGRGVGGSFQTRTSSRCHVAVQSILASNRQVSFTGGFRKRCTPKGWFEGHSVATRRCLSLINAGWVKEEEKEEEVGESRWLCPRDVACCLPACLPAALAVCLQHPAHLLLSLWPRTTGRRWDADAVTNLVFYCQSKRAFLVFLFFCFMVTSEELSSF